MWTFRNCIMLAVRYSDARGPFDVLLKGGLWKKRIELVSTFFETNQEGELESTSISGFITSVFELVSTSTRGTNETRGSGSDDIDMVNNESSESLYKSEKQMRHNFGHLDVVRTIIDFGRCFCSGSIAVGALRGEDTIRKTLALKNHWKHLLCVHIAQWIQ